ncbi:MAG TPA: alpha/beta hydrolase [Kofleriaceae bacterium]|jgi:pimeloyl-ACP methyl ester carboxylesterase
MRLAILLLVAAVGCGNTKPAEASQTSAPTEAFTPTAFTVTVSGQGRPIIFIPGLGCPGDIWAETAAHLHGYQAHVLTLAGFAGQPRIAGPLAATTRAELAHYIRSRHLDHPIIVGHSMGGFIAYWLAASEPELVGPVIVVDSGAALGDGDADARAAAGAKVRDMWKLASDDQYAQQVKDVFGAMAHKSDRLAPFLAAVAKSDRGALGDAVYELFTTDVRGELAHIHAPLLLILSDGSLGDGMRAQAEPVPDHEVVVVPGAGHFVMLDEPAAFYGDLDTFLAAHTLVAGRAGSDGETYASSP